MKEGVHPQSYVVTATCACGNSFVTRSTKKTMTLEICSACHPFFTGKQKFVDTEGRIDKFLKKFAQAKVHKEKISAKKKAVKAKPKVAKPALSEAAKKSKVLSSRPRS